MSPILVPQSLQDSIHFLRPFKEAKAWLDSLPSKWGHYAGIWNLTPKEVLRGGCMSCCLLSESKGKSLVLKLPLEAVSGLSEATALSFWSATKAVPCVQEKDDAAGVFLMDFVLDVNKDHFSVPAFVDLLDRLFPLEYVRPLEDFPSLAVSLKMRYFWAKKCFLENNLQDELNLLYTLKKPMKEMLKFPDVKLVHGDLQTKNILSNDRLYAIDPLPGFGDPCYDAAFWCVMQKSDASIKDTLLLLHQAWPQSDLYRLTKWAEIISALEVRTVDYQLTSRIKDFLDISYPFWR